MRKKYLSKEQQKALKQIMIDCQDATTSEDKQRYKDAFSALFFDGEKMALKMAHKYDRTNTYNHAYEEEDVLQDARLALCEYIANKYNPDRDTKLLTGAAFTIKKKFQEQDSRCRTIPMPRNASALYIECVRAMQRQIDRTGIDYPTNEVIEEIMQVTGHKNRNTIVNLLNIYKGITSLDYIVQVGSHPTTLEAMIEDERGCMDEVEESINTSKELQSLLECLEPIEKNIIQFEYGILQDRDNFLRQHNITKSEYKKIVTIAMEKLQAEAEKRGLKHVS